MNTPHPELEELAALVETDESPDAAGSPDASTLSEHVAGCARCSADVAALRDVRTTLRSLPPVTMPDDVAQRLESVVRDTVTSAATAEPKAAVSVLPAAGAARRGGRRGSGSGLPNFSVAASVAVFLVIALGVGLGVALSNGGESKGNSAAGSAASEAASIVVASGMDYTQDSIRNQVAGLVLTRVPNAHTEYKGLRALAPAASAAAAAAPSAPAVTKPSAAAGGAIAPSAPPKMATAAKPTTTARATTTALPNSAPQAALPARSPYSGPLSDPAKLQACVQALLAQPATPVLVDYAYYAGKPATIIVLREPSDPSTLNVYVESGTADCADELTLVAYLHNVS